MTPRSALLVRLAGRAAGIVLAAVFQLTLAASGQSKVAAPMPGCGLADHEPSSPLLSQNIVAASKVASQDTGVAATGDLLQSLRSASFPELSHIDLRTRTFHSQSDYLRTRFSIPRFFLPVRMRYYIDLNPALFAQQQAPPDGLCGIVAHELAHVVVLSRGNRIRRLGLIRLLSRRQTVSFERGADLDAIHRGYGDGLKSYRSWVYSHIPSRKLEEKLRNYFSPEEIATIQKRLQEEPDLFVYWRRHVPTNLEEIQRTR